MYSSISFGVPCEAGKVTYIAVQVSAFSLTYHLYSFLKARFALSVAEKWSALDGHLNYVDFFDSSKNIQKIGALMDLLNGGMSTSLDSSP